MTKHSKLLHRITKKQANMGTLASVYGTLCWACGLLSMELKPATSSTIETLNLHKLRDLSAQSACHIAWQVTLWLSDFSYSPWIPCFAQRNFVTAFLRFVDPGVSNVWYLRLEIVQLENRLLSAKSLSLCVLLLFRRRSHQLIVLVCSSGCCREVRFVCLPFQFILKALQSAGSLKKPSRSLIWIFELLEAGYHI